MREDVEAGKAEAAWGSLGELAGVQKDFPDFERGLKESKRSQYVLHMSSFKAASLRYNGFQYIHRDVQP